MINLKRRLAIEGRMRAMLTMPVGKERNLPAEGVPAKWHKNDARAFVLQSQDESLDQGNAAMLANGTEPGLDMIPVTPMFEGQ